MCAVSAANASALVVLQETGWIRGCLREYINRDGEAEVKSMFKSVI